MEFTNRQDLEGLQNSLLIREADLIIKFINEEREQLKVIKEIADSRVGAGTMEMYDGDFLVGSDRELLKEVIGLLVALDKVTENQLPEWRSSADLILEVEGFYNKIENDAELRPYLSPENL
jgi:hypothetical protein